VKLHHMLLVTSAVAGLGGIAAPAHAQTAAPAAEASGDAGDVILVTARRKSENLQTVPIAVTAINQDTLSKGGSFSPLDLAQVAPGVRTMGNVGNRSDVVYSIRGQSMAFGNIFPAVVPYFAEVPIVGEFSTGSFFDLENVQVLRGPQGVRFGRVTDGGAVLLQPKRPTSELGGYLKATFGNYDLHTFEGAVNVPIVSDKVLLRVAGESARRGGFTTNIPNNQKLDNVHYDTIRATLTLRPVDGVENITTFQYNEAHEANSSQMAAIRRSKFSAAELLVLDAAAATYAQRGPRYVINGNPLLGPDYGIFGDREQTIISNITRIDVTDDITFRNIIGYVRTRKWTGWDYDGSPLSVVDSFNKIVPRVDQRHMSIEPQVIGKTGIVDWIVGAYFDKQDPRGPAESVTFLKPSAAAPNDFRVSNSMSFQTTKSTAFYGQAELDLGSVLPGLKVSGGIRRTHDSNVTTAPNSLISTFAAFTGPNYVHGQCNPAQPCTTVSGAFNVTTYEVGASYKVSPDVFTYVTYRKGYRPGGFNLLRSSFSPTGAYGPEYDKSLELGLKVNTRLGEMPFKFNLAAFYDRYTDIQKRINLIDNGTALTILLNVKNPATVKGIELETSISPVQGLDIGYNMAVTDAKFKLLSTDTQAALFNSTDGACNGDAPKNLGFCPLNRFAATPDFQMTASIGYTLPLPPSVGDVRFGLDWYHQSSMAYTDSTYLTPDSIGKPYSVLNANVSWRNVGGENVDLTAFVTNLTNEVYWQGAQTVTQNASSGIGAHFYAPPRMFGLSARVRFGGER